jgi:TonB-dependent starch-binding outer membrane protein SusC
MKKILLMTCCWLLLISSYAQQRSVTGQVTDDAGLPLPGVSVVIKGTTNGTVSDSDGRYSLNANQGDVLSFSFIGFEPKEVNVGAESVVNVSMVTSISTLEEVVVIGFGEREKKDLTGAISTVNAKDISSVPFASPQFALQGKTTGVRVVNQSGDPSASPLIFIRGLGTWNGSSQPLYVIDGQIITPPSNANRDVIGNINLWTLVNPSDIESMSVLKDATAAAIYGSRAANGVILITTKRGKKGRPVIEFNSQVGVQNIPTYDVLNASEYVQFSREIYTNSLDPNVSVERNLYGRQEANLGNRLNNFSPQFDPESEFYVGETPTQYNWQDEVRQKNAMSQDYNIKLSGSNEATDYYISLGYTNQESVLKGSDLERYNLAINLNSKINKFIRSGLTYKITYQESDQNTRMQMREAAAAPVWQPLYDANNRFGYAPSRNLNYSNVGQVKLYGAQTRINPLALMDLNFTQFNLIRNLGQGYLEVEPIKGLTIRGTLSGDYTYQQRQSFTDVLQDEFLTQGGTGAPAGSLGFYGLRTNKFFNLQADLTTSFNRSFGKHNVSAVFVIQDQSFKNWTEDFSTRNAQTRDRARLGIPGGQAPGDQAGFSGLSQKFWYSYVSRAGYNYNDRYYLDVSFRRDASNGFPKESRWGNFYSVAGAWRLSAENFMQGLTFLDDLKLRAGWGQTGNDEAVVGNFSYISKVTQAGSYSFGSGNNDPRGRYLIASSLRDLPNKNIFWEVVSTSNIGVDASFLGGKITSTIEYFNRVTNDVLQAIDIPLSVGTNNTVQNIGSLKNSGVELEVGYNNRVGDFTYGISGNVSFVQNKVTELYNDAPLTVTMNEIQNIRVEEGRSIGHIWGYQVGGIFRSQEEIDQFYATTPDETNRGNLQYIAPGDMYFVDVYGNPTDQEQFYSKTPDGRITAFDQTELGKTIPGHTYGLNLTAGYKGLDLTVNFYGEGDVQKINQVRRDMEAMNSGGLNPLATVRNRYTPSNPNASMPRAVFNDPANNNRLSSRWVEDAGFFRLNTWQLGYSINNEMLKKTNVISRVRVYVGGQNNMLITNYSGLDPVNDLFPLPKSYFVGLNATF